VIRRLFMLAAIVLLAACEGRPAKETGTQDDELLPTRDEPHVGEINLRGGISEAPSGSLLSGGGARTFADLVLELRAMRDETELKAVFVRLGVARLGLAQAEEIGRMLEVLRKENKLPVVCHADGYTNASMLLAARGCDDVWLSPAGNVETVGIAGQLIFFRRLLDQLQVEVDFIQVGKFKGAQEPFTRENSSAEARASLQRALGGLRHAWLDGIEAGRGKKAAALQLEAGPHAAGAAKKLGLIDNVGFERDARNKALERASAVGRVSYFGGRPSEEGGIADLVRILSGTRSAQVPHIAVVSAVGAITLAPGGSILSSGDGIAERRLSRTLHKLRRAPSVKAVVLRIDSPGGSALASDLLWRSLMDLREEKPLVVSVGSMAASGGYYMACAANKIVVERSSILGSIGVVAGKLSFATSLREVGINVETVPANEKAGARALWGSPLSPWDDATRAKLRDSIESTYDLFIERIAKGRSLPASKIAPSAEGRIMGGDDAKAGQLVDELGGLERAITLAIELAEAEADIPVHVVRQPTALMSLLGIDSPEARAEAARELERQAARHAVRAVTEGLLPFRREIGAFSASLVPLSHGEQLLTALPYALIIQ
jgi:protease-4